MKKIISIVLLAITIPVISQNQGTALYQMTIEGLPPEQAAMMGDMDMKIVWKDDKSYVEQNSMMYSMKTVADDKSALVLMEIMGNKTYMRTNMNDLKDDEKAPPEYKIEYANDTKKVAGYDCKKAIVTGKTKDGKELNIEVWYSEQIPNVYNKRKTTSRRNQEALYLKSIKGMPLEYSIPQGEMTVRVTAKEINFNPVSDDIFVLSTDGYTEVKPEDMKKMRGGQ